MPGETAQVRTVKRDGVEIRQKKCQSECGKWRDEIEFHYRTPEQKTRSSRCRYCAAKAQRDLRLRKKNLLPKKPGGRFGVDPNQELSLGNGSSHDRRKAG